MGSSVKTRAKAEKPAAGQAPPKTEVHATAVIDAGAVLGAGTQVWHFSHVMTGAVLGRDCRLGQNVFVGRDVRIGDRVKIQNNVSVYSGVTLEDDVFCGPSVVFTNVRQPRAAFPKKAGADYQPTRVRRGATLGANCTIVCGVEIGEHAFVGAGSVVTRNVPAYALVYGNPARHHGWMCACGQRLSGVVDLSTHPACSVCGRRYGHGDAGLQPIGA